jgi:hypothetical protein
MAITTVSVENYKPFKSRFDVEIRPLTILIGKNSSGKSALARLPLLLGQSLSPRADAPLDLFFDELDFGSSFRDLVHGRLEHGNVGLGASFKDVQGTQWSFWAKVQDISEFKIQVIAEYHLVGPDGWTLKLVWNGNDPLSESLQYIATGSYSGDVTARFAGLLPQHLEAQQPLSKQFVTVFRTAVTALSGALTDIAYLGPFRQRPLRRYRFPGSMPRGVGLVTGRRAPEVLYADRKKRILPLVGEWFREHLGGWRLDLLEGSDGFEVVLTRGDSPDALTVNLVDVGHGMNQVLPLIVQRMLDSVTSSSPVLEIIEQPELHLHPAVHGALATIYASAITTLPVSFLIETHSEIFCLRIRKHVAAGFIKPEQVRMYSVEAEGGISIIKPINLLAGGEVDYWPIGVFSEDFDEVREIRRLQRA